MDEERSDQDDVIAPCADAEALVDAINDAFGFPASLWESRQLWRRGGAGSVWLADGGVTVDGLHDVETVGMVLLRDGRIPTRLSTCFIRRFGSLAERGVIELTDQEAHRFGAGGDVPLALDRASLRPRARLGPSSPLRYVIVAGPSGPIGRGRLGSDGLLVSEVPKAQRWPI